MPAAAHRRPAQRRLLPKGSGTEIEIVFDRAERCYRRWPSPTCIISDGPYGVSGFPGDEPTETTLPGWYERHAEAWAKYATPLTTLWFWNTEIGWAAVHPILAAHGWVYRGCNVWDKGMSHVAGNCNTRTLRKFPVVTEVCVQYVRSPEFRLAGEAAPVGPQRWLRHEWRRTGLPLREANAACGVKNAATRKYLTADHLWYLPPPEAFEDLADYAQRHGRQSGRPYFSVDGVRPLTRGQWAKMRAKFDCPAGVTNVWHEPQLGGSERVRGARSGMAYKYKTLHGSRKPLKLIERRVRAGTDEGDVRTRSASFRQRSSLVAVSPGTATMRVTSIYRAEPIRSVPKNDRPDYASSLSPAVADRAAPLGTPRIMGERPRGRSGAAGSIPLGDFR